MSAKQADKPRVLVVTKIPPDLRAALATEYELVDYPADAAGSGPFPPAPGHTIAVTMVYAGASAKLMEALPDLRLIASGGVGLDRIDLNEAKRRGIAVTHTPDELTEDTSDAAIGLIFAVSRRMVEADRFVRSGRWLKEQMSESKRVSGRRIGIVGLGKIGRAIARKATGLGMSVSYTGPQPKPDLPYTFVSDIAQMSRQVDVLVLSCPGGESTRGLIGRTELDALGSKGILINVSRGSVVDEPALIEALTNRTIAGAGLDVFASEPDIDPRFRTMENVVLQPHYAAITSEMRAATTERLCREIRSFVCREPFLNVASG
ncbi:MAG: 2-hydroxyacid dehydrogenase [Xanthobacteraceae bacterium]